MILASDVYKQNMWRTLSLPPIVPKPAASDGWHIGLQALLQGAIEIKIRAIRKPVNSVFLKSSCCIGCKSHADCCGFRFDRGLLVCVVHALPCVARDELDVNFMIVVFVEECAMACARNRACLECGAYTAVEDVFILSGDLSSENGRLSLASRHLELQTSTIDCDIGCSVLLGKRR